MSMRLISQTSEWINRTKKIRFTFEGHEYEGYEGDTISSALWASGQKILGRSFKYHRPRGILSFANHDVNVMVTDGRDTNMRGDVVSLKSNMNLMAVNTDGGVEKDKNSYIDSISPLLPVGFYYKAFHTPRKLFPFWEKVIRKAAGLGVVNFNYPRELKRKTHEHCDVLVIGAGASGLTAALFAAEAGLSVVVVDENQQAGGALNFDHSGSDSNKKLLEALLSKVAEFPNISLLLGTYAGGYYNDHLVPLVSVDGIIKMRAKSVIVASGAFEQPPVFRNNDLPGVMLGSAAQRLMARYSVKPFNRGVVFTANDYGYRVALDLIAAGVSVAAVVDLRESGGELAKQVISRGVKVLTRSCVYEALPTAKNLGVKGALICGYDEKENIAKPAESSTIECDGIVMCAGWAPAAALLYQAGTGMRYDDVIQQFVPARLPKGVFAAGRVNGVFDAQQKMLDGARAASDALRYLGFAANQISVLGHEGTSPSHAYPIVPHPKGKNFIDFDEDIQLKDFINAAKEGFDNIELMKRFTTVGMGPSQGKHSNMNAIRILARIRNLPVEKIGTTTARPFFHPTPIGHLGGRGLHPHRLTPMHRWNQQAGAVFTDVGAWKRAAYYSKAGLSAADCIQQEASAVRNGVGMIDGSSLGKIEIHGPDASHFLERFFTGSYASQKVGESRYAMMLDESGVLVDDGLLSRMAIDQFYLTIGTSNAAAVYREMQKALQQWQLGVTLVNVTGAVALINVAGPASRQTLEKISGIDLSDAAFPLSAVKETEVAGVKVKMMRVAFVSNLAYEIHVPAAMAQHVWEAIFEAGKAFKITPFGTDAQRLLRLEMGHHMPGIDTDGLTNPFEVHADWAIQMGKPYFVGQRSLKIIQKKPVKKCLVAFVLEDHYSGEIPKECNLAIDQGEIAGRVTSIAYSKSVGRVIGFAYVNPAKQSIGSEFQIRSDSGAIVKAEVVTTPFFKA